MKRLLILPLLAMLAMPAQADDKYREFTSTDGKTIRGAVMAYDAQTETVTIERDNKRTSKVPLSVFSEADQTYILEWEAAKGFLKDSGLKITVSRAYGEKRKEEKWDEVNYDGNPERMLLTVTTFEKVYFKLNLQNRNASELKDIRIDYIIYYEQSEETWETPITEQKTKKGSIAVPVLNARDKSEVSTDPVEIFSDSINQINWTSGKNRTGGEGEVHGMRARLYMKMSSGKEFMRELTFPEKLSESKFTWVE